MSATDAELVEAMNQNMWLGIEGTMFGEIARYYAVDKGAGKTVYRDPETPATITLSGRQYDDDALGMLDGPFRYVAWDLIDGTLQRKISANIRRRKKGTKRQQKAAKRAAAKARKLLAKSGEFVL
tara:strand:- start:1061 stop:1435 length:375 start_codon:yes stop_codon:yes gene_type:complete